MNRRVVVVASVALAVLMLVWTAFVAVDFAVAASESGVHSQVSTASGGDETLDLSPGVVVHVVDGDRSAALEAAVVDAFADRGVAAESAPDLRATYGRPVLFVVPDRWSLRYVGVNARATVDWHVLYVQSGNATQFGVSSYGADDFSTGRLRDRLVAERVASVRVDDWTRFVRSGDLGLEHDTDGLVSLPAAHRLVRTAVADATVDAVVSG